jgi:hypothetical protein
MSINTFTIHSVLGMIIIQVDRANSDVRNTNLRLKKTITEVIDMINCAHLCVKICYLFLKCNFVSSPAEVQSKFLHRHHSNVCSSGNHYVFIQVSPLSYPWSPSILIQNMVHNNNIFFLFQCTKVT